MRAVVRSDLTVEMVDDLVKHIQEVIEWLQCHYQNLSKEDVDKIHDRFQPHHRKHRGNV